VAAGATGCGASAGTSSSRAARPDAPRRRSGPASVRLAYRPLFALSAAVQDPASAALADGRFVLLGGLDAADTSTAVVTEAGEHGARSGGSLPGAQHDAQAASLAGAVYVFGGGQLSQYNHILRWAPPVGPATAVGALPNPESDVAVTELGGTAYVVGGFDGSSALDTIVAWRPGGPARVAARLPVALRYAAVAAADGAILILGGSTPAGASRAIYRFTPGTGTVRQIGRLPEGTTHAGAAVLGSTVYLVGGRGDSADSRTAAVYAVDPASGKVTPAGHLPQPLSDAAVVSLRGAIIVAGGHSPAATVAGVGELTPVG